MYVQSGNEDVTDEDMTDDNDGDNEQDTDDTDDTDDTEHYQAPDNAYNQNA